MSTKTISITEDAYERLACKKSGSDSFSDVIMKLTGKASLMDIAGILTKEESKAMRKHIEERRKSMRSQMEKTSKRLSK